VINDRPYTDRVRDSYHDAGPDSAGLRLSIEASPTDDAPKLIYADWLDENGHAEKAAAVRRALQPHIAHPLRRIDIDAHRANDEPHRIERLRETLALIDHGAVISLLGLFDNKGWLTATWWRTPTPRERAVVTLAWIAMGELVEMVEHVVSPIQDLSPLPGDDKDVELVDVWVKAPSSRLSRRPVRRGVPCG
jgi:uncharacterized protein (TIGR02996 family)